MTVCNERVPVSKLAAHYALELSRLQAGLYPKDTSAGGAGTQRGKREAAVDARKRLHAHVSKGTAEELDSCRQVVIRVRRNRLGRVNDTKSTKPRTDDISDSATYNNGLRPKCPICLSYVDGDDAGVNFHIDACLQREGAHTSYGEGTQPAGGGAGADDEDVDSELDIEEDEANEYGDAQITEADVRTAGVFSDVAFDGTMRDGRESGLVVSALKSALAEQQEMNRMRVKCLICLVPYHANMETTVSIKCWHVHCTQCWLHVLGAKRLCPQCNIITAAQDLRRIYL